MPSFNYKQQYDRYKKYYLSLEPLLNKPSNRAYTAVIFSFLAVSLFGWYAIRPTMQTIFTLKREISDRTEINKKMEDKISALIEAQAGYENVQSYIPELTDALPTDPEPARALVQLRGLATDSGVVITTLTAPGVELHSVPEKNKTPASAKPVSMAVTTSVTGSYPQVKNFLLGIFNLRRIMQITSLSFSPNRIVTNTASPSAQPSGSGTQMQVDLKLNVFYLK